MKALSTSDVAQWFASLSGDQKFKASHEFHELTGGTLSAFVNPRPVAVALVPVATSKGMRLLGLRRTIEPAKGRLALPGGFLEPGEYAATAAEREVREETGLCFLQPSSFVRFGNDSPSSSGDILLFCRSLVTLTEEQFLELQKEMEEKGDGEADELVLIDSRTELGFPLHQAAAIGFFAQHA